MAKNVLLPARMRGLLLFAAVLPLLGQNATDIVPLPLINQRAVEKGENPAPLTPGKKAKLAFENTFGLHALANRALLTGIDQLRDEPWEWPGNFEGYGMRYGSRLGRLAVRNAIMLGTDVAFKIDPRYDRCSCSGVWPRLAHAYKRVVVARTDAGGQMFNVSRFTGAYATPLIADQWNPDRLNTWGEHVTSGSVYLAWHGLGNVVREFWPEIRRAIPFRKPKS